MSFFPPPSRLLQNIWSLVRSRPSLKAVMNYISRDIITQEPWTNARRFKFYRFFFLPSSSNFCPRWTRKVFLQNAQRDVMLIKVIVQWLGTISSWNKAFLPHAPPALQVLRPASSTCLAFISRGSQRRPEWRLIERGKLESAGFSGPTLCSKDVAISFEYQIRFIHLFSHEDSKRLSENPLSTRTWKHSFG